MEDLKHRLAALGVIVVPSSGRAEGSRRRSCDAGTRSLQDLKKALVRAAEGDVQGPASSEGHTLQHGQNDQGHPACSALSVPAANASSTPADVVTVKKPKRRKCRAVLSNVSKAGALQLPLAARPRQVGAPHTPLAVLLAQLKESEAAWAAEKAHYRREADQQRRRAQQLDLDCHKLKAAVRHQNTELKALRSALRQRDDTIADLNGQVQQHQAAVDLEGDRAAAELAGLAVERTELQKMLNAALKKLEAVSGECHRCHADSEARQAADANKAARLQEQLAAAQSAARAAQAQADALRVQQGTASWKNSMVSQVLDLQITQNKAKADTLRDMLGRNPVAVSRSVNDLLKQAHAAENYEEAELKGATSDVTAARYDNSDLPPALRRLLASHT